MLPASSKRTSTGAKGFRLLDEGPHSLLARPPGEDRVIDYVHVFGKQLDSLRVDTDCADQTDDCELDKGQGELLAALPLAMDGKPLGGAFKYTWSSSDETIVSFDDDYSSGLSALTDTRMVWIVGEAPGVATITVTTSGKTAVLNVRVNP